MVLKGKLNESQLQDLDALILRLKSFNRCNLQNQQTKTKKTSDIVDLFAELNEIVANDKISIADIRPLPPDDNRRLWEYIRHCCKLAIMKNIDKVRNLCLVDNRLDIKDLVEDAIHDISIHVYRYVWRKYEHSEDAGYVMNTAYLGFRTWNQTQIEKQTYDKKNLDLFEKHKADCFSFSKKKSATSN